MIGDKRYMTSIFYIVYHFILFFILYLFVDTYSSLATMKDL
ncbi:uncharacterized protein METZ01_LOCUS443792 [marine metagenome]|uniref:Uncharacterized protein n=1 Tax=marine metagenome TaxID=408172 RepID=A0A382Z8A1_9ZZZZ